MSTSSHQLCIDDHSYVFEACARISDWEKLASYLKIGRCTVEKIRVDIKDNLTGCVMELLSVWLKIDSKDQPIPSWRILCNAIAKVDLSHSNTISSEHQCGCHSCTGIAPIRIAQLEMLSPHYNDIYYSLGPGPNITVEVAQYLFQEETINFEQLNRIKLSEENGRECLLTTFESCVSNNPFDTNKVFAAALCKHKSTRRIGNKLITAVNKAASSIAIREDPTQSREAAIRGDPTQSRGPELHVDEDYKSDFHKMEDELILLCEKTISLLQKNGSEVNNLKDKLRYFRVLKKSLHWHDCQSLRDIICDVVKPNLTLVDIDYLKSIFRLFDLDKAPLQHYEEVVKEFSKQMLVEHAYGKSFMASHYSHMSKAESVTFVLDWKADDTFLEDIQSLFKKVFKSYSKDVKVLRMMPTNSIMIECYVPAHLQPVIIAIIQEKEQLLKEEKVLLVKAGNITIFENKRLLFVNKYVSEQQQADDTKSLLSRSSGIEPDKEDPFSDVSEELTSSEARRIYSEQCAYFKNKEAQLNQQLATKETIIKNMLAEQKKFGDPKSFVTVGTLTDHVHTTQLSYTGQLCYTHGNNANEWIVRFMAAKDLEALQMFMFKSYPDAEIDQIISFNFGNNSTHLELVMDSEQDHPTTGWELIPHANPLKLSKDAMDLFGTSDGTPDPPTCMITVLATPGTNTQSSLKYSIPIMGVVSDTEQICIVRSLESSSIVPSGTTPQQLSSPPAATEYVPIRDIINCIKEEFIKLIRELIILFETCLDHITSELFAVGLVVDAVARQPTPDAMINGFFALLAFTTTIVQLTEYCHKFFNAMYKVGGGFSLAADTLKERINNSLMEEFNITLDL